MPPCVKKCSGKLFRHLRRIHAAQVCLVLFFAYSGLISAAPETAIKQVDASINQKNTALDSIKARLETGRRKLAELSLKEGAFTEKLTVIEENMSVASRYLDALAIRISETSAGIAALNDSLALASAALEERQARMSRRLRMMYMTGTSGFLGIAVSSTGLNDLLNRMTYFQTLKKYDESLMQSIETGRRRIAEETEALLEKQDRLMALRSAKESEHLKFLAESEQHKTLLLKVRGERAAWEQNLRELESAQKELAALLESLLKKRSTLKTDSDRKLAGTFEKLKGNLPWPAGGNVVRGFGKIIHPIYKTVTVNTGIDIGVNSGAEIRCVASGKVDYAGWMRGYGNFVIVNHPGGYVTIYAHLDQISVSVQQQVESGSILGRVMRQGNENSPRIHFQIRREAEPLDPGVWLEAR
jgi:septal ring factor EnvC (AmiA/AmiB activator)